MVATLRTRRDCGRRRAPAGILVADAFRQQYGDIWMGHFKTKHIKAIELNAGGM
jgi:hypothetical protein